MRLQSGRSDHSLYALCQSHCVDKVTWEMQSAACVWRLWRESVDLFHLDSSETTFTTAHLERYRDATGHTGGGRARSGV